MRKVMLLLGAAAALAAGGTAAAAQCLADRCAAPREIRLSTAVEAGAPLIWSPRRARLVPAPSYGFPILLGHTMPLDDLLGRRVVPVDGLPRRLIYNAPDAFPDVVDPGVTLMPLPAPGGQPQRRGAYP